MKAHFFLTIVLITIVLIGWTYINYSFEHSKQAKLDQLSRLPVYIYVADTTKVAPLMIALAEHTELQRISLETGLQAVRELAEAYQLPHTQSMLEEYSYPDVITLVFKPIKESLTAKAGIINAIMLQQIEMTDIDSQSNAWLIVETELKVLNLQWLIFTLFTGLILMVLFVFARLSLELRVLLKQKRRLVSVVDLIRHKSSTNRHTWMLLVIPILVSVGIYYLANVLDFIKAPVDWIFVAIQLVPLILGTLVILIILNLYSHDASLGLEPIVEGESFDARDS
ncbi:MAG: hypothetical protein Q8M98_09415 [Candidatus Cloacimonadaceae bacterium]|nr:hypothetical protein [Candidatus Cloacimonadaceae bacterium]MDP3114980.1 hypothetical protein [Candidatus Cloacimonadaceae bacterium]